MKLLLRTPVFVGLLVVLAAGGGVAGAALGHRTPPNAVTEYTSDCKLNSHAPAALLLPPSPFVHQDSANNDTSRGPGLTPSERTTCRTATDAASVTVLTRTAFRGTPAQLQEQFADANRLRVEDASHVSAKDETLVWPTAAFGHYVCHPQMLPPVPYVIEVHLSGDAGKGTPHRDTVMGDVVARARQELSDRCS